MITYRLALAVYARSPAAYEALKSFKVLQLPSKRSLQAYLSANSQLAGVDEARISEQRDLYDAFVAQKKRQAKHPPLSKGILIFDEVKVQSKVNCPVETIALSNHYFYYNYIGDLEYPNQSHDRTCYVY